MRKILWIVLIVVFVGVVGAGVALYSFRPDYNEALSAPGLTAEVVITRNTYAMPYIKARNMDDLYFAWGYINAQDRMFQLEMTRRIGQGRLAETLGPDMISKDLFLRAIDFYGLAQKGVNTMKPENLRLLQRYADGVNFFQETHTRPLYMILLGMQQEKWSAADPLVVGMMLNWTLAYNMKHELIYYRIAGKIGQDRAQELLNLVPAKAPAIIPRLSKEAEVKLAEQMRDFGSLLGGGSASNNWVIAPGLTQYKGPILANDPHVHGSKIPNDFYLMSGEAGDFRIVGGQAVGLPFIAFGYNKDIAWGVTNQGADIVDLYLETIDWEKKTYRWGEEIRPLTEKSVILKVKGKEPIQKTFYYAGRRPVLTEVFPDLGRDVSLDWAGLEDFGADGFLELNRARNLKEWETAAKKIKISPQNMVYADRTGQIAYRTVGVLVDRVSGTGNFPAEAALGQATWKGILNPDLYPAWTNPEQGWIVTTNNKVIDDFVCDMNAVYAPQYRYEAVTRMLKPGEKVDVEYTKRMQTDVKSGLAPVVIPLMKGLIKPKDSIQQAALDLVLKWDGSVKADQAAPAIYNTWLVRFMVLTFADELGEELASEYVSERYISLERFFELLRSNSDFFDDKTTPTRETPSDMATKAMAQTVELLSKATQKTNPAEWTWGQVHLLRFEHLLGKSKVMRPSVNLEPTPLSGDGETNLRAHYYEVLPPYSAFLAAGLRLIVAFDPDPRGHLVLITGENEFFLSRHYKDLTDLWLQGGYMEVEKPELKYEARLRPMP